MKNIILLSIIIMLLSCTNDRSEKYNFEDEKILVEEYKKKLDNVLNEIFIDINNEETLSKKLNSLISTDSHVVELNLDYIGSSSNKNKQLWEYNLLHTDKGIKSRYFKNRKGFGIQVSKDQVKKFGMEKINNSISTELKIKTLYPNLTNQKSIRYEGNISISTHNFDPRAPLNYKEPYIYFRYFIYKNNIYSWEFDVMIQVPLNYESDIWWWEDGNQHHQEDYLPVIKHE